MDLVERALGRDEQAWRELVAEHGPRVWAVARAHRLNDADAADVFQTTWLNLAEHLGEVRDSEKISAWLATAAKRECLRVIGLRRPLPVRWRPEVVEEGPEGMVLQDERDRQLWAAFRALPDRCQRLLRLFAYAPEYSYAELAGAVGIEAGSVGPTKARCLRALRLKLDRRVFDQVDPMPDVIAVPGQGERERFELLPERGTRTAAHSLRFGHGDRFVQLEIDKAVTGLVVPVLDVQVWWPDGMIAVDVDDYGLFTADVPRGPVRLVVDRAVTDWFVR